MSSEQIVPTGEVHPAAALFPMMTAEELDDLAADIREHGLAHPIVLDQDGTLIDGRNRLTACRRAGVEPTYSQLDDRVDPAAYILSLNVHRRMLTRGQRAMAVAKARLFATNNRQVDLASAVSVSQSRVAYARVILDHAPDLADKVLAGGSLDQAYAEALRRKRQPEERAERERLASEARAAAEQQAARREEELRQAIDLAIEAIGPEVDIPVAPPNLDPRVSVEARVPVAPRLNAKGLAAQAYALGTLNRISDELEKLSHEEPALEVWSAAGHVSAIRSAISQIVTMAYAIAEKHNARLGAVAELRRVK